MPISSPPPPFEKQLPRVLRASASSEKRACPGNAAATPPRSSAGGVSHGHKWCRSQLCAVCHPCVQVVLWMPWGQLKWPG